MRYVLAFNVRFIHLQVFEQGYMYLFCSLSLMSKIDVFHIFALVFLQLSMFCLENRYRYSNHYYQQDERGICELFRL